MNTKRLYALNESLLDEVKPDEVRDDAGESVNNVQFELRFDSIWNEHRTYEYMTSMFRSYMDALVDSRDIDEYSFSYHSEKSFRFRIEVHFSEMKQDVFDKIVTNALSVMVKCHKNTLVKGDAVLRVYPEGDVESKVFFSLVNSALHYELERTVDMYGLETYKKIFDIEGEVSDVLRDIVKLFIRYGIIVPMDETKSRYHIYLISEHLLCVFDKDSNFVFDKFVYSTERSSMSCKYNRFGYMVLAKKFNEEYNLIDLDGNDVLEEDLKDILSFERGFGIVLKKNDSKRYIIDEKGNFITDEGFVSVNDFNKDGYAIVRIDDSDNCNNLIDANGTLLFKNNFFELSDDQNYEYAKVKDNRFFYYIDRKGKELGKEYNLKKCYKFIDGFAKVEKADTKQNFLKTDGTLVSEHWHWGVRGYPQCGLYACLDDYQEGYNFIEISSGKKLFDEGFYNCSLPSEYEYTYDMHMCMVSRFNRENGTFYNYVTSEGKLLFEEWSNVTHPVAWSEDVFCIKKKLDDGKIVSKLVRKDGTIIKDYMLWEYDNYIKDYKLAYVKINDEYGIIMDNGERLCSDLWFDSIGFPHEGFFGVKYAKSGYQNIYTVDGKALFKPMTFKYRYYRVLEPNKLVIVVNDMMKSNVFDCDGNKMFDEWLDEPIEKYGPGLMKIGNFAVIDYEHNYVSFI